MKEMKDRYTLTNDADVRSFRVYETKAKTIARVEILHYLMQKNQAILRTKTYLNFCPQLVSAALGS